MGEWEWCMRYEFSFQSERVMSSRFTLSDARLSDGGLFWGTSQ